jgi:hypothetical protein
LHSDRSRKGKRAARERLFAWLLAGVLLVAVAALVAVEFMGKGGRPRVAAEDGGPPTAGVPVLASPTQRVPAGEAERPTAFDPNDLRKTVEWALEEYGAVQRAVAADDPRQEVPSPREAFAERVRQAVGSRVTWTFEVAEVRRPGAETVSVTPGRLWSSFTPPGGDRVLCIVELFFDGSRTWRTSAPADLKYLVTLAAGGTARVRGRLERLEVSEAPSWEGYKGLYARIHLAGVQAARHD